MTTFRTKHDKNNPYFQMNRAAVHDETLSYKALGILVYLLSKPDNWETRLSDLVNRHADGRESVRSGLKELEDAGYLKRSQERGEDGQFSSGTVDVYEKPSSENPITVNSPLVINDVLVSNEKTTNEESEFGKVIGYYQDNIGVLTPIIGDKIKDACEEFSSSWIIEAIEEATTREKRSWSYVMGCLKNWKREGKSTAEKQEEPKVRVKVAAKGGDLE